MIGNVNGITARAPANPLYLSSFQKEVRRHGVEKVFENRANRAEIFRREGFVEEAKRLESEAERIIDIFA